MARGGDAGQAARRSRGARAASPARGSAFGKRGGGDKEVALGAPCERFPKAGKIEAQHGQGEHEEELEFGGWPGALALMVWSHCMPLYMWIALEFHGGSLFFGPAAWHDPAAWSDHLANDLLPKLAAAWPTAAAWAIYGTFFTSQVLLFYMCPGVTVQGLPVPSEGNRRLVYHCNAFCSWIVTLMAVYALHTTGVFSMGVVGRMRGQLLVVAMIVADVIAVTIYLVSVYVLKTGYKVTGNHLYDFFMGTWLNPRIGSLDLKLWAEIKVSWVTFFLLVLSSAIEQYEKLGYLSNGMIVVLLAQLLYANACMKGEECVVSTWDIFAEKWGWMLIYWNLCGVPFVYSYQAAYLAKTSVPGSTSDLSVPVCALLCVVVFAAYYVWDVANQQKNTYRIMQRGDYKARPWYSAFPQLPGGILYKSAGPDAWKKCRVLKFEYSTGEASDESGSPEKKTLTLLVDGMWAYGRKVHYGMDIVMALVWAFSTVGATPSEPHLLCFFYPAFFTGMIIHRWQRDDQRCRAKYGEANWAVYCKHVPYVFFPGIW